MTAIWRKTIREQGNRNAKISYETVVIIQIRDNGAVMKVVRVGHILDIF